MTDKQIQEKLKSTFRLPKHERTPEIYRLRDEMYLRQMINSIIAYGDESDLGKDSYKYEAYIEEYEDKIGLERVNEIIAEQIADIREHAEVYRILNSDGSIDFASISWKD